jgi:hypothetical protein
MEEHGPLERDEEEAGDEDPRPDRDPKGGETALKPTAVMRAPSRFSGRRSHAKMPVPMNAQPVRGPNDRNAVQTVVVQRGDDGWSVALFQTTAAQLHGRPELTDALTAELADLLPHH